MNIRLTFSRIPTLTSKIAAASPVVGHISSRLQIQCSQTPTARKEQGFISEVADPQATSSQVTAGTQIAQGERTVLLMSPHLFKEHQAIPFVLCRSKSAGQLSVCTSLRLFTVFAAHCVHFALFFKPAALSGHSASIFPRSIGCRHHLPTSRR